MALAPNPNKKENRKTRQKSSCLIHLHYVVGGWSQDFWLALQEWSIKLSGRGGFCSSVHVVVLTVSFNLLFLLFPSFSFLFWAVCVHFLLLCAAVMSFSGFARRWPSLLDPNAFVQSLRNASPFSPNPPILFESYTARREREQGDRDYGGKHITHRQWRQSATSCRHGAHGRVNVYPETRCGTQTAAAAAAAA